MAAYPPATRPTLYFIGVTTGKSSIMTVFPAWAEALGLADAVIRGIDFPLHADPAAYREAVAFIRTDPLSRGALITTHKIDLFHASRDLFDELDPHAARLDEVSCLSKSGGRLVGHAKDPISAGLAFDAFVPAGHFARTGVELFTIGAGGAAIALTWHAMHARPDRPARIVVSDRSPERLEEIRRLHGEMGRTVPVDYVLAQGPADNDTALRGLKPGSVVVNATGLGKDAPGSPLGDDAPFPQGGLVWDLNYRGDLLFLDQARRQQVARGLTVEDGWTYFIHGWTRAIAEIFHIEIPTSGPRFDELSRIAASAGRG
ncbi:hypothetical protein KXS07_25315 [Inquilinus limosus]|uniref:shikimate dehydrogenase family protein n=1 Tax=Inquilinus limosus TaxID=171674 RepID=UPI003F15783B